MLRRGFGGRRFVFAAAGIVALGGAATFVTPSSAQPTCEYTCRVCTLPNEPEAHDIVQSVHNDASSSHLENCNAGDCSSHACESQT